MKDPSQEMSPAQRNRHPSEVPMPEQKTGDVPEAPQELPHMPPKESSDANPSHPPSERA